MDDGVRILKVMRVSVASRRDENDRRVHVKLIKTTFKGPQTLHFEFPRLLAQSLPFSHIESAITAIKN